MLYKNSCIAFTGTIRAMHPERSPDIRGLIAKRLTQNIHQIFHVVANNIFPPQVLISLIRINVHNRLEVGADFKEVLVLLVICHDRKLLSIFYSSARSIISSEE